MSSGPDPDRGVVAFGERLLTLLGEGRFAATYKYAVLLALIDLCLEQSSRSGAAPNSVTTRQLAEKVLELYWPQSVPFAPASGVLLRQNNTGQAEIVELIRRFRERHAPDPSSPLSRARAAGPARFERLVRNIEWKLIEMPLPRLQVVGNEEDPFIYRINWDRTVRRGLVNDAGSFDNVIRFVGEAGDHLVRLAGLLRPLVQREWAALVAQFNRELVPEFDLDRFLFGAERVSTAPLRAPLRELSSSRCFYCEGRLPPDFEVDHFIPWARHPDNGIENLVAADPRCNSYKREHLAATEHVHRWVERARRDAPALAGIASDLGWDRHPERSFAVARSIYLRLPARARLWRRARDFVEADRARLLSVFS
jgi:hypothetical protein